MNFFSYFNIIVVLLIYNLFIINALKCYSCSYSMLELTPENDDFFCANESLIKIDRDLTTRICAPWEKFCMTTVETSLKAFSAVIRACGDICREPCESDGYGTDMVRCDHCCTEDFCNGNYSVRYYMELMKQQHTSWIKPLVGEKLYNCNNNITFPY
uniref:Bm7546 n=1 Tax=Brugia malayi TaxID=6279 RepID=A0A1I9G1L8_BRUMA|nr:Bm7546 [Brugia malayi]